MKKIITSLFLTAICLLLLSSHQFPAEWNTVFENEDVKIEYQTQNCDDLVNDIRNNYNILKVTNKTDKEVQLSFLRKAWYNTKCYGCDNQEEHTVRITLQPRQVVSGSCTREISGLQIYHSNNSGLIEPLERFELTSIKTSKN